MDSMDVQVSTVDGIDVTFQMLDGSQTWTWDNPRTGDRSRLRYTMRDRLYLYLDHGKTGEFFWTGGAAGIPCGDHPEETAHAWITGKIT